MVIKILTHADKLGTLTWKYKRSFHHLITADPQVNPAPTAPRTEVSPG